MTRSQALNKIRYAGYHGDKATFTSTYIDNRISLEVATFAFREGGLWRQRGVKCNCDECKKAQAHE